MKKLGMLIILAGILTVSCSKRSSLSYIHRRDDTTTKLHRVAVLNLDAVGVSGEEAKVLSGILRSNVIQLITSNDYKQMGGKERYEIIEGSQMERIFDEYKIQSTGHTSDSSAIELGKMLSADTVIVGSVGHIGQTYTLVISIIEAESAKSTTSVSYTHKGEIDGLIDLIPQICRELLLGSKRKNNYIHR